jgi:hypothetical protein
MRVPSRLKLVVVVANLLAILVWLFWPKSFDAVAFGQKNAPQANVRSAIVAPRIFPKGVLAQNKGGLPPNNLLSDTGINLQKYDDYLEKLCPKLTPAEEAALLAKHQRSPEILALLALMNSSNKESYLKEALSHKPASQLVLFAAIGTLREHPERAQMAAELGGVYGDLVQANELLKRKENEPQILERLIRDAAAVSDKKVSLTRETLEGQISLFEEVGRDSFAAMSRVHLTENGQPEFIELSDLYDSLSRTTALEGEEAEPLIANLLELTQNSQKSLGFELNTAGSFYYLEERLLKRLLENNSSDMVSFLTLPVSEALKESRAEASLISGFTSFDQDKPGIFMRLNRMEQEKLISEINEFGEVAAYGNVFRDKPAIFTDPDFKPQGMEPAGWYQTSK